MKKIEIVRKGIYHQGKCIETLSESYPTPEVGTVFESFNYTYMGVLYCRNMVVTSIEEASHEQKEERFGTPWITVYKTVKVNVASTKLISKRRFSSY